MEPVFDTEDRSTIQAGVTTTVVAVPGDVHEKIREIVSLLSRALILSLSLLKAMVPTDKRIENGSEHMVLEEGVLNLRGQMESVVHGPMPDTSAAEQGHVDVVIDNRDISAITIERGHGAWDGYTGLRANEVSPIADTGDMNTVEL